MSTLKRYAVSCSSDGEVNVQALYVWGQFGTKTCLPITKREAEKMILVCLGENKCGHCDAQVHLIEVKRTKETLLQFFNKPEK